MKTLSLSQQVKALMERLREEKDRERQAQLRKDLVHLYVRFGEFFKMDTRPDPHLAKQYLKKALKMDPRHPVAHYRLAHLYYRENSYHRAAFHFMEALRHGWERGLTDTQKMLSHMLLVNCGLDMMKESLSRLREMEESLNYDETLVEKYREMVYLTDLDHLNRALYRIITPLGERIVTEETYFRAQDEQGPDEVDLEISHGRMGVDHELVVRFRQEAVPLDYKQFFLVAYLLHAEEPLTYEKILTRYYWGFLKEKVQADTVRQTLRRINRKIFFFDQIMETAMAGGKAFLRRKEGIAYRIFCRASDLFPWEMEGEYT